MLYQEAWESPVSRYLSRNGVGIGVTNLAGLQRLIDSHQLIPRGKDCHEGTSDYWSVYHADGGEHTDLGRPDYCPTREQHLTPCDVLTAPSNSRTLYRLNQDTDLRKAIPLAVLASSSVSSKGTTVSVPDGIAAPVMMRIAVPGSTVREDTYPAGTSSMTDRTITEDELAPFVSRARTAKSIHGGIVHGRNVQISSDIGVEDLSQRIQDRPFLAVKHADVLKYHPLCVLNRYQVATQVTPLCILLNCRRRGCLSGGPLPAASAST